MRNQVSGATPYSCICTKAYVRHKQLEGDANGAPHPAASAYASKFSGRYEHRLITGGVGHNLPQEAPGDFAQAVIDVDAS
jgi:hypothetical protein